jgi:hypothetical protein
MEPQVIKPQDTSQDIRNLVIARLNTLPSDREISVGGEGEFTREDVVKAVEQGSDLGKKMIEIEMAYLRMLKEGIPLE